MSAREGCLTARRHRPSTAQFLPFERIDMDVDALTLVPRHCPSTALFLPLEGSDMDVEAQALVPRCCQRDAYHFAAEEPRPIRGLSTTSMSSVKSGRWLKGETSRERRWRRIWEKQRQVMNMHSMAQIRAGMEFAKEQILQALSTSELLETAESVIEEDWLGKIDEMRGRMYFIGAFGSITRDKGLKAWARLLGCIVIALIQLLCPPAVFFSTILGWGIKQEKYYHWENWHLGDWSNMLHDWRHVFVTKALGLLFICCFVLNGLFVLMDHKQDWFKIYNMFCYLQRRNLSFELGGQCFLFAGAFMNCWTVLWCCISSYVVVGASDSPKTVLFDALGMLFLFNLDAIGGELGFVAADDWPGLRLGWIHAEMVRKDWRPSDGEEEDGWEPATLPPCVKECGRPARPGLQPNGKPYDTCCRGCATGQAHDPTCRVDTEKDDEECADEGKGDWYRGGWIAYCGYQFTIFTLSGIVVLCPLVSTFTPFLRILPADA